MEKKLQKNLANLKKILISSKQTLKPFLQPKITTNMKMKIQLQLRDLGDWVELKAPYSERNKIIYRQHGGYYDKPNRRWILPKSSDAYCMIASMFGNPSPSVIASVAGTQVVSYGNELFHGGYIIAGWDGNEVCLPDGVELAWGEYDLAASKATNTVSLVGTDVVFHAIIRQEYAVRNGLQIIEEVTDEWPYNPFSRYPDGILRFELERRGYRVRKMSFY